MEDRVSVGSVDAAGERYPSLCIYRCWASSVETGGDDFPSHWLRARMMPPRGTFWDKHCILRYNGAIHVPVRGREIPLA